MVKTNYLYPGVDYADISKYLTNEKKINIIVVAGITGSSTRGIFFRTQASASNI